MSYFLLNEMNPNSRNYEAKLITGLYKDYNKERGNLKISTNQNSNKLEDAGFDDIFSGMFSYIIEHVGLSVTTPKLLTIPIPLGPFTFNLDLTVSIEIDPIHEEIHVITVSLENEIVEQNYNNFNFLEVADDLGFLKLFLNPSLVEIARGMSIIPYFTLNGSGSVSILYNMDTDEWIIPSFSLTLNFEFGLKGDVLKFLITALVPHLSFLYDLGV